MSVYVSDTYASICKLTPQVSDAVYMYVNTDALVASPSRAHGEVCHLRSYAGQGDQALDAIWDF
jgi:hypothetical protein